MSNRLAATAAACALLSTAALAVDLHEFWDSRCQECHGHAGPFARRHLDVVDGQLVGSRSRDLKQFLITHEAGAAQAENIYAMLLAQAQTKPVYQAKCAGCHDNAAALARASLELRDGSLDVRSSRQPVAELLKRHGKLTADEIPIVVESLARVLREIGGSSR
jgi:cytochrome c5